MRRQSRENQKRMARDQHQQQRRESAVTLLKDGKTVRAVSSACELSIGTVMRIKKAISAKGITALEKLLNPAANRAGRKCVVTVEEETLIKQRMIFIATRGFAMDVTTLRSVLASIAADGRKGFANGIPSDSVVRSFRTRNRDITFRNTENKENAKLRGENFSHVQTYATALRQVVVHNPGIYDDENRVYNLDETHVDGEFGHRVKVFGSSRTHQGGFRVSAAKGGSGKHVTAVVVTSASGRKLPPFLVFAGKNTMSGWFEPLPVSSYKDRHGIPHWLTIPGWFPNDAVIVPTENGSMEKSILLCLDGHSSRNGHNGCRGLSGLCEDELCSMAISDTKSIGFKLMLAVAGYRAINEGIVQASFTTTGLWPMDY
eukprot:IDg2548t1